MAQKRRAAQEQQMAREQKAVLELEVASKWMEYEHPSHALQSQSQLEVGGQNDDAEEVDELLIENLEADREDRHR